MNRVRLRVRWVVAVPAVVAVGIVVWGVVAVVGQARTDADAMRVYCLAPKQQSSLLNAAAALDLGKPGESGDRISVGGAELTVGDWRDRHTDDFEQACEALSAAQQPGSSGVFATALPFLTALVGAGSAYAATSWRDRIVRGQNLADDLRAAAGGFFRAAEDFLENRRPGHVDPELSAQRLALTTQVSRARAAHPDWAWIRDIEAALTSGALGPSIATGWRTDFDGEAVNDTRLADLRVLLATTRDDVFVLADRVQRPLRAAPGGAR